MKNYFVYTDGSCFPNPGAGSCAFIVLRSENESFESIVFWDAYKIIDTTSIRMEIEAFIKACNRVFPSQLGIGLGENISIHVKTDSMFLVNVWNKWLEKWEKANYKDRKNVDQLIVLTALKKKYGSRIQVSHVRGHSGIFWNEAVDQLTRDDSKFEKNIADYDFTNLEPISAFQ